MPVAKQRSNGGFQMVRTVSQCGLSSFFKKRAIQTLWKVAQIKKCTRFATLALVDSVDQCSLISLIETFHSPRNIEMDTPCPGTADRVTTGYRNNKSTVYCCLLNSV